MHNVQVWSAKAHCFDCRLPCFHTSRQRFTARADFPSPSLCWPEHSASECFCFVCQSLTRLTKDTTMSFQVVRNNSDYLDLPIINSKIFVF